MMTETAAVAAAPKKKVKSPKVKSAKKAASHPPTATLVNNAIKHLKERGGSSLQAIKKYIGSTYKIDADKIAPFVKKYLKSGVEKGVLIRTKGKGASGSFKLALDGAKAVKTPAAKKAPKARKVAKKAKSAAKPKSAKPKAAKKASRKATKAPAAKKPKAPKPKKAAPKKVAKKVRK